MNTKSNFTLLAAMGACLISGASLYASDADNAIEASVKKSYVFTTYLKDDAIKTRVTNGVVTLTGTVADASQKTLAENTVESLPGVQRVNNELEIKGDLGAQYSDVWLSTSVRTTLQFHRSLNAKGTQVDVKNGIVNLRGVATSLAQKELTTEYARDVQGVTEVRNEMTIVPVPAPVAESGVGKIDDASITAQVKTALMAHRAVSALHLKVSTADGIVLVLGTADYDAQRSLVTKIASDIFGVASVINNITLVVPLTKN